MDDGAIQEIKGRLDIVEVVRRYVDLRPVSGRWMGACPFHQETKPSLSVNSEEGFYYCFGCQAAGDVISFYQRINGLEFKEALEQLATEAGVELRGYRPDPEAGQRKKEKKACLDLHELAAASYARNLGHAAGRKAARYLAERGLNRETVESFRLGYSLDDWQGFERVLLGKGFTREQGVACGLLTENKEKGRIYDRFRDRLIFPISDLSGKVIAFGGRILTNVDDQPKYINSSDSPIYKKGDHLYGLFQARGHITRTRRALLTEGYMDVLSMHQFGYREACGVLGTALTPEQVKRLSGFCNRVDLVFDGDAAGRKAALKSAEMILHAGMKCKVVLLPEGEDVDSILQDSGREGFEEHLQAASEGLEFCLKALREDYSPKEIMDWARNFLSRLGDDALAAFFLPRIAAGLGVSEAGLRSDALKRRGRGGDGRPAAGSKPQPQRVPVGGDERADRYYLRFAAIHPDCIPELDRLGLAMVLASDWGRSLWSKAVTCGGGDLFSSLDDRESAFWARCRMEPPYEGETLEAEWSFLTGKIEEGILKGEYKRQSVALLEAQQNGDMESVRATMEHLKELRERINILRSALGGEGTA